MNEILADIITIGDEILYGQTVDTNSAFMAIKLKDIGIKVRQITSISDKHEAIMETLTHATSHSDIVLLTGGLGPTRDDITKHSLCTYFNDELALNEEAWTHVQEFYASRNRTISEVNRQQAFLPTRCICLPNRVGTASGMWFEQNNTIVVSMPGVPREMKKLMEDEVIPRLTQSLTLPELHHAFINTVGVPESTLAEKIHDWELALPPHIKLAYLPTLGQVKLRLTLFGTDVDRLAQEVKKVIPLIEEYIYAFENTSLEEAVAQLLKEKEVTISTAESCTGGAVAKALTSVAGSSAYFMGSVVAYANEVKMRDLKVSEENLASYGAVSEQVVAQMASGARQRFSTDLAVATTGVAGPDGGTPDKPVGTVWIAIATGEEVITKKLSVGNLGREHNIEATTVAVLNLIRKTLNRK